MVCSDMWKIFAWIAYMSVALALTEPVGAIPPPVAQQSADCAHPVFASDILVCGDDELRSLDAHYATAAQRLIGVAPNALWEEAEPWFLRRSQCAFLQNHRECLIAAYSERMTLLDAATSSFKISKPIICTATLRDAKIRSAMGAVSEPLVISSGDNIAAIASPRATGDWKSFLSYRLNGHRLDLFPLGGKPISCKLVTAK